MKRDLITIDRARLINLNLILPELADDQSIASRKQLESEVSGYLENLLRVPRKVSLIIRLWQKTIRFFRPVIELSASTDND